MSRILPRPGLCFLEDRIMNRLLAALLFIATLAALAPSPLYAQADARAAFDAGKAAYKIGDYEKARQLFLAASQTDNNNPEVFLWLGNASYQLGSLQSAIDAWSTTIRLAPNEPTATKMLAAIRGDLAKIDNLNTLIENLLRDRLYDAALIHADKLLTDKALTDSQRAKTLTHKAQALIGLNQPKDVPPIVRELLVRYPKLVDPNHANLLLGQALLRIRHDKTEQGLALLRKVIADAPGTPPALSAELELIAFDLDQAVTPPRIDALLKWLAANPQHPLAQTARSRLLDAQIAAASLSAPPRPDAPLAKEDATVLQTAADLFKLIPSADDADQLTRRLIAHIDDRYLKCHNPTAAVTAADLLLKSSLPRSSRLLALRANARYRTEMAFQQLSASIAATAGAGMKNDPLPQALADMLAAIALEFPSENVARDRAELADRLRQLSDKIPSSTRITEPKAPLAWALQIAIPIIKENSNEDAINSAVNTLAAVVNEIDKHPDPNAHALAASINAQLLAAIHPNRPAWTKTAWRQVSLLNAAAQVEFHENSRAGRYDNNATLSPTQLQLLATLANLVTTDAFSAPKALDSLSAHLQTWTAAGHYKLAEDAYTRLAKPLPASQQRSARLAVAGLRFQDISRQHSRLLAAGLNPPRQLEPSLKSALEDLYSLQANLTEADPFIVEVRNLWNGIITHYKHLEYFDVAEQAVTLTPPDRNALADAHAQLQLATLRHELASRELTQLLKRLPAQRKLTLTPAWQSAINAYQKFISTYPQNPFVDHAANQILSIARDFEQYEAFDVAADILRNFAAFAAKTKPLSDPPTNSPSVADRAALAVPQSLEAQARAALVKSLADRTPGSPPPAKLSDECSAALASYKDFIKARPNSPLVGSAIRKASAIALEYARADAWNVAQSVYSDLLAVGLPLRAPERLEFARAVCILGKAIPQHARDVLTTLTAGSQLHADSARFATTQPADIPDGAVTADARPFEEVQIELPKPTFHGAPKETPFGYAVPQPNIAAQQADIAALSAITQQESRRAAQVASLGGPGASAGQTPLTPTNQPSVQQAAIQLPQIPLLSDAEIARIDAVFSEAYLAFSTIRVNRPATLTAELARNQILLMIAQWRDLRQSQRSAALAQRFLADNPTDHQLPLIRLQLARDYLAYAAQPIANPGPRQTVLADLAARFDKARDELARILSDFPDLRDLRQQAQWDIATSFLSQARAVDAFSPTLARGQFVRAARQLQQIAKNSPEHPNIPTIPQTLSQIASELAARSFFEEALIVWNDLINFDPTHPLAQQAAPAIAAVYQNNLNRPLRAVEAYLEINFTRGGNDQPSQTAVFQIGSQLRDQKRWIEALAVLETFVASFPRHPNAGQALTMVGQIHQANEAWIDAITAYKRVIAEFPSGNWVQEAKWSIADCTINLSLWRQALQAYQDYVAAYPKDARVPEATRRISILKDLDRYQTLVNEPDQRKAFDAQFQIATIVQTQLNNPTKAIIEFRKVAAKWPASHLADAALLKAGTLHLSMGDTAKGREVLLSLATKYPDRTLAADALYHIGKSYEEESQRLAGLTRLVTEQAAQEQAQKFAYQSVQLARGQNRADNTKRLGALKSSGKADLAELEEARQASNEFAFNSANFDVEINKAAQFAQNLSAVQLADRQDKINASLRRAVQAYNSASRIPGAEKAGDSLLRMSVIYDEQLKDPNAALATWLEIVRQFNGTAVAEEASWRLAQYYDRAAKWTESVEAYKAFLRSYRASPKAPQAHFAIAEAYEHLGKWVEAMDAYNGYLNNFPEGPLAQKAKEQINWIKTYRL